MEVRIPVNFATMHSDPKQRVVIEHQNLEGNETGALQPNASVIIFDKFLQVRAVLEYEDGKWMAIPDWNTRVDLGLP
jgi:hypothetical protein